jgi:hypothetical protein
MAIHNLYRCRYIEILTATIKYTYMCSWLLLKYIRFLLTILAFDEQFFWKLCMCTYLQFSWLNIVMLWTLKIKHTILFEIIMFTYMTVSIYIYELFLPSLYILAVCFWWTITILNFVSCTILCEKFIKPIIKIKRPKIIFHWMNKFFFRILINPKIIFYQSLFWFAWWFSTLLWEYSFLLSIDQNHVKIVNFRPL